MSDELIIPVPPQWERSAHVNHERYGKMMARSLQQPDAFWGELAEKFTWHKRWDTVKNTSFGQVKPDSAHTKEDGVSIKWFEGGTLNISENCLDRHLASHGDKVAILWEGDNPAESRRITYSQLHGMVCRFANALKNEGVQPGDRVTIYMPMIPEAAVAMLACARIGAVHSVVFGGFSAEALKGRIEGCESSLVITADEGYRGGKTTALKANVDEAIAGLALVKRVIVVRRTGGNVAWDEQRDRWYHELVEHASELCPPAAMDAEAPLFILYTSGSTGKPKGVLHTTAGYMLWAATTFFYTFDYKHDDIFWCTADVGWVTGHTYITYGPLLNAATMVMFEGIPNYPASTRMCEVIDKYGVTIFYTAPTAIRALAREGNACIQGTTRKSLRLLGSVGEPINPEAWLWYYRTIGQERCPIIDTWWQTETGGQMITPLPGATPMKPGSAAWPFFGVQPMVVDSNGKELEGACEGLLCIRDSWPGQARSVYGDHERFEQTYFSQFPGLYFTGDGVRRDKDGYYWITGRVDDVLNVSGHRLGTAEIESALVGHASVAEAAVVGFPHDIKGQGIYAYVTLNSDVQASDALQKELVAWVRKSLSPIATPDRIHFTPELPKTRSGKIMRRILRKIAEGDISNLGDTSTLTNPAIVGELIREKKD